MVYKITPDPIEFDLALAIARQHVAGSFAAPGADPYWISRPPGAVYRTQVLNFAKILINVIRQNRQMYQAVPDAQIQIVLDNMILPPLLRNVSFSGLILDHCQLLGDYAFSEFGGVQFLNCQFPENPTYIKFGYDGKECWQENLDFKAALYTDKSRQAKTSGDFYEAHALNLEAHAFQRRADAIRLRNQALYAQAIKLKQEAVHLDARVVELRSTQGKKSHKENEGPISLLKRTSAVLVSSREDLQTSGGNEVLDAKRLQTKFFAFSHQSPVNITGSLGSFEQITSPSRPL
jgi:hypothetical protein